MGKDIGKNISRSLSSKYNQKLFGHGKQTPSKVSIQKTSEATGDLIGNKIVNEITKVSRNSLQNNSEAIESETEIHIYSSKKRQKIIAHPRVV